MKLKDRFDMRKESIQRTSSSEVDSVIKRLNQQLLGGGGRMVVEEWRMERDLEVDAMSVSRVRVWDGRRLRSLWERKVEVLLVTVERRVRRSSERMESRSVPSELPAVITQTRSYKFRK